MHIYNDQLIQCISLIYRQNIFPGVFLLQLQFSHCGCIYKEVVTQLRLESRNRNEKTEANEHSASVEVLKKIRK
jgi:hypothetical protein